jgi:hypothetical protein
MKYFFKKCWKFEIICQKMIMSKRKTKNCDTTHRVFDSASISGSTRSNVPPFLFQWPTFRSFAVWSDEAGGNANKRNGDRRWKWRPFSCVQESHWVIHIIRTYKDVFSFWVNESTKDAVDYICSLATRLSLHSVSSIYLIYFKKKEEKVGERCARPFSPGPAQHDSR